MSHVATICRVLACLTTGLALLTPNVIGTPQQSSSAFHLQEATIDDIQQAILSGRITTRGLVELYLNRIKAFNGTCVNQPQGILGPVTTIARAGQINALSTLNLRPASRKAWGFDERKARSLTDPVDGNPQMPDALETADMQDRQLQTTRRLAGPLHGVVMAIKDQYDTFDMRTTSGADVDYANDRPRDDATFVPLEQNRPYAALHEDVTNHSPSLNFPTLCCGRTVRGFAREPKRITRYCWRRSGANGGFLRRISISSSSETAFTALRPRRRNSSRNLRRA